MNFVREILCCRLAASDFAYKILRRRLAARNLPREIACGRTQAIADLHKGHAARKLAEELVKPLLCCLLETLLKVPQPKHGG